MCGIWGLFAKNQTGFYTKDEDIVEQMMYLTALRGVHSTGIAITSNKKPRIKPRIWKTTGGPCYLIQTTSWDQVQKYLISEGGSIFGHGRFATKGDIVAKNAHPFSYKNITLVHNGTIHTGLTYEEKDDSPKVEVDSHALCIKMAKDGIKSALMDVGGAYAIIAHDAEEGCIFFARNTDRPLHIVESNERVYLMSSKDALELLMKNNSYYNSSVRFVASEVLYKYDLSTYKVTEVCELRKKYTYQNNYHGGRGTTWGEGWGEDYAGGNPYPHLSQVVNNHPKPIITFMVESVTKVSEFEYLYEGETEDGQPVEFRTNDNHQELILKTGKAEVAYEIVRNDKRVQFVRFKNITWEDDQVKTLNGVKMSKEKWKATIKAEQCGLCDGDIKEEDVSKTIIDTKGIVCKDCVGKSINLVGDE